MFKLKLYENFYEHENIIYDHILNFLNKNINLKYIEINNINQFLSQIILIFIKINYYYINNDIDSLFSLKIKIWHYYIEYLLNLKLSFYPKIFSYFYFKCFNSDIFYDYQNFSYNINYLDNYIIKNNKKKKFKYHLIDNTFKLKVINKIKMYLYMIEKNQNINYKKNIFKFLMNYILSKKKYIFSLSKTLMNTIRYKIVFFYIFKQFDSNEKYLLNYYYKKLFNNNLNNEFKYIYQKNGINYSNNFLLTNNLFISKKQNFYISFLELLKNDHVDIVNFFKNF